MIDRDKIRYFQEKAAEVRKAQIDFQKMAGDFDNELADWMKTWAGGGNLHIIDLLDKATSVLD